MLPYIERYSIKMIAMTGQSGSVLAQAADAVIDTSVEKEACPLGLAPTASTSLTLALGDALAVCLLERKGFCAEDFAETHPCGLLGRRLLVTVKDAMCSLDDSAVVDKELTIKSALPSITKGEMGFTVVCSGDRAPVGVFTDGDLRRCLGSSIDIQACVICDYMTTDFLMIGEGRLAVEAVNLMNSNGISAMPVIDENGRLAGVIGMKQLIAAGVV